MNTALVGLSLAAALVLGEGLSWVVLSLGITNQPLVFAKSEAALHIFERSEGGPLYYGVKPHYRQHLRSSEFESDIRTNNIGFREGDDFEGKRLFIGVMGDSFAFGAQVQHGQRFSDLLRHELPGSEVMSYSYANGYAPPHYYAYLRRHPELIPRLLILTLYPYNDFLHDIQDSRLILDPAGDLIRVESKNRKVSSEGFWIAKSAPDRQPWWFDALRLFHAGRVVLIAGRKIGRSFEENDQPTTTPAPVVRRAATELTPGRMMIDRGELPATAVESLGYVRKLNKLVTDRGGRMLVFYVPAPYMVGDYPRSCSYGIENCRQSGSLNGLGRRLGEFFRKSGISFVDPTDHFRHLERGGTKLHFAEDAHWRPAGHREVARLIAKTVRRAPDLLGKDDP